MGNGVRLIVHHSYDVRPNPAYTASHDRGGRGIRPAAQLFELAPPGFGRRTLLTSPDKLAEAAWLLDKATRPKVVRPGFGIDTPYSMPDSKALLGGIPGYTDHFVYELRKDVLAAANLPSIVEALRQIVNLLRVR